MVLLGTKVNSHTFTLFRTQILATAHQHKKVFWTLSPPKNMKRKGGLHFSESYCDFVRCSNPSMAKIDSCGLAQRKKEVRRSKQKLRVGLKSVGTKVKPGWTVSSLLFTLCGSCLSFSASLHLYEAIIGKRVKDKWPTPSRCSPVITSRGAPGEETSVFRVMLEVIVNFKTKIENSKKRKSESLSV